VCNDFCETLRFAPSLSDTQVSADYYYVHIISHRIAQLSNLKLRVLSRTIFKSLCFRYSTLVREFGVQRYITVILVIFSQY
jgi:hypothetical protein